MGLVSVREKEETFAGGWASMWKVPLLMRMGPVPRARGAGAVSSSASFQVRVAESACVPMTVWAKPDGGVLFWSVRAAFWMLSEEFGSDEESEPERVA